jgi:hypothetical protein
MNPFDRPGYDDGGPSRETLNLPHMIGLPNRAIEQISRSWSFFVANHHRGLPRVGIGNVNDQVS